MSRTITAADMIKNPCEVHKISLGCQILDKAFGGGFPVHGIHEICGEAGCGKTQFCLQISLQACLPSNLGGLEGSACYLSCGEGHFPVKRLEQLVSHANPLEENTHGGMNILEKVLIRECPSVDSLFDVIENQLPLLLSKGQVKVVVIDSVAGAFRSDEKFESVGKSGCQARSRDLFLFAALLRRLSFTHHVPFIVVNQATSSGFDQNIEGAVYADALRLCPNLNVRPALGLSWTSCINSRVLLTREKGHTQEDSWKRHALLMMSSCSPLNSVEFIISELGVRGTPSAN